MITLLPELDKTEVPILLFYRTLAVKKTILVATSYGNVHSPFSDSGNALQVQEKAEADNVF